MRFKSRVAILALLAALGAAMASPALASGSDSAPTNVTLSNPQGGSGGSGTVQLSWGALPSGVTSLTANLHDTNLPSYMAGPTVNLVNQTGPANIAWAQNGHTYYAVLHATYADGVTIDSAPSNAVTVPTAPDPNAPAQVGVGVSGTGYIGDARWSYSTTGTAPIEQGTSASWNVTWSNTGNKTETLTFSNVDGQSYGMPAPYVPASWVIFSQSSVDVPAWQSVTVTVTVTVPAGAAPGLYTGVAIGTGVIPASGSGIQQSAAAGMREYVQVAQ